MEKVRDVVVTVVGVLGILTVAWLVAAWMLHLSLIALATGSMSPTMPAGSAAVVQEVSAADLAVGDVVTVPREGSAIPVTHRIVDIAPVSDDADARALTLRGDANAIDDLEPYVVTTAKRVVVSAPALGSVLLTVKSPVGILVATLGVASIVVWALWPARTRKTRDPAHAR